jgi:hypothetical protein
MKKLLLLLLSFSALAATPAQIELKLGYFRFGDSHLRKVYHQDALDTQLTVTGPLWKWLNLYAGINYISREGRTRPKHHYTKITIIPLSLGLRGIVNVAHDVDYYLTLGPRYFSVQQTHHSTRNTFGGFINTGFLLHFRENLFIDFFSEYSQSISPQVGGLTIGGGLGYQF